MQRGCFQHNRQALLVLDAMRKVAEGTNLELVKKGERLAELANGVLQLCRSGLFVATDNGQAFGDVDFIGCICCMVMPLLTVPELNPSICELLLDLFKCFLPHSAYCPENGEDPMLTFSTCPPALEVIMSDMRATVVQACEAMQTFDAQPASNCPINIRVLESYLRLSPSPADGEARPPAHLLIHASSREALTTFTRNVVGLSSKLAALWPTLMPQCARAADLWPSMGWMIRSAEQGTRAAALEWTAQLVRCRGIPQFCVEPVTSDILAGLAIAACTPPQPADADHSMRTTAADDALADTHAATCLSTLVAQGWAVFPSVHTLVVDLAVVRGIQRTRCAQLKAALANVLAQAMRVRPVPSRQRTIEHRRPSNPLNWVR
jgi:hypothetical protein